MQFNTQVDQCARKNISVEKIMKNQCKKKRCVAVAKIKKIPYGIEFMLCDMDYSIRLKQSAI